jgi:carotenoid 1,2-hydratase
LTIDIDERGAPLPRRVRGRIRVEPESRNVESFALADGHFWRPIAPLARVAADFAAPQLRWTGSGYLDSNWGAAPLEAGFRRWTWSRARTSRGATVLYDYEPRGAAPVALALKLDRDGRAQAFSPPPRFALRRSAWGVQRETRSERDARLIESLEDTPFYSRGLIEHRLSGEVVRSVHESLDLDRFANPIVRAMLPFRMPRWG